MPHRALKLSKPAQAPCAIDVLIVGGSVAGLSCAFALRRVGHRVTLLERSPKDKQLCPGSCRLTPNASKVLLQWGLREELDGCNGGRLDTALFYTIGAQKDEFLGGHYYSSEIMSETGGGEWRSMSYIKLRETLHDVAARAGADIRLGVEVVSIDPSAHTVTDANGNVYAADLIIAADGALGIGRKVLGGEDGVPSIYTFYTTILPAKDVEKVPELIGGDEAKGRFPAYIRWGDGYCLYYHVMNTEGDMGMFAYSSVTEENESWDDPAVDLADVLTCEHLPDWVRRLCSLTPRAYRCQNRRYTEIEDWSDEATHSFVLLGEAAHPSPEGSLQSFGMSLEDSAVLAKLFSHLRSKEEIPHMLAGYQEVRQERVRNAVERELHRLGAFTLKKGPEQEARDQIARITSEEPGGDLGVYKVQELEQLFTYDCEDEAEGWWHQWNLLRKRTRDLEEPEANSLLVEMKTEVEVKDVDSSEPLVDEDVLQYTYE